MNATPRPWRFQDSPGEVHRNAVFGPPHPIDGGNYAALARLSNPEDAKLIVTAVNEYDNHRALLERSLFAFKQFEQMPELQAEIEATLGSKEGK